MVLKIQGKVPFALDESRDNKKMAPTSERGFRMENEAHTDLKKKKKVTKIK